MIMARIFSPLRRARLRADPEAGKTIRPMPVTVDIECLEPEPPPSAGARTGDVPVAA
jgi:hypothetical protein